MNSYVRNAKEHKQEVIMRRQIFLKKYWNIGQIKNTCCAVGTAAAKQKSA